MFRSLLSLIVDNRCRGCEIELSSQEHQICLDCYAQLVTTDFHHVPQDNPLYHRLAGRVELAGAWATYLFEKGSVLQKLITELKYRDAPHVGYCLGQASANELIGAACIATVDVILPVPLHPWKKMKRGYNQSDYIANGLGNTLGVRVDTTALKRTQYQKSQTKIIGKRRWDNVKNNFRYTSAVDYQHVLLVDDIVTTGATVEACIRAIRQGSPKPIKVSIMGLGFANKG